DGHLARVLELRMLVVASAETYLDVPHEAGLCIELTPEVVPLLVHVDAHRIVRIGNAILGLEPGEGDSGESLLADPGSAGRSLGRLYIAVVQRPLRRFEGP